MIIITEEELAKLKPLSEENKGVYGTCFLYENDFVLKTYLNTLNFHCNRREIKRNIKKNVGIKVENVSFPIEIAKVEGYNFSYIMPYIEGISFEKMVENIKNTEFNMTFEDFAYLYHDAISKADEIASLGIEMTDFHKDNCKIKEDFTIGIYDIDFYEKKKISGRFIEKYLAYHNMLEINDAFFNMIRCFYNKRIRLGYSSDDIDSLRLLSKIIEDFPRNKRNYVDDVLTKINDELKKDTIKDLIIR